MFSITVNHVHETPVAQIGHVAPVAPSIPVGHTGQVAPVVPVPHGHIGHVAPIGQSGQVAPLTPVGQSCPVAPCGQAGHAGHAQSPKNIIVNNPLVPVTVSVIVSSLNCHDEVL